MDTPIEETSTADLILELMDLNREKVLFEKAQQKVLDDGINFDSHCAGRSMYDHIDHGKKQEVLDRMKVVSEEINRRIPSALEHSNLPCGQCGEYTVYRGTKRPRHWTCRNPGCPAFLKPETEFNLYINRDSDSGKGGYVNQYGRRVPNPCREIDERGRNMDKIYRNLRPEDIMDEETLDRLNELPDP